MVESRRFVGQEIISFPHRMQTCFPERLIRIDIPKTGQEGLIQQQGFELTTSRGKQPQKILPGNLVPERFRPQSSQDANRITNQPPPPEFPRIMEPQLPPSIQNQPDVLMAILWLGGTDQSYLPGHTQVDDQMVPPVEHHHDVLGSSLDRPYARPPKAPDKQ
jgi:hypothetical protein